MIDSQVKQIPKSLGPFMTYMSLHIRQLLVIVIAVLLGNTLHCRILPSTTLIHHNVS